MAGPGLTMKSYKSLRNGNLESGPGSISQTIRVNTAVSVETLVALMAGLLIQ